VHIIKRWDKEMIVGIYKFFVAGRKVDSNGADEMSAGHPWFTTHPDVGKRS